MIRTGFVKEKKGEQLRVCFERPASCEGCKGCAKGLMSKSELLTVFGEAEVGDVVDVQMPENRILQASLLAYALPLLLLLAGLSAGYVMGLADIVSLLLALGGLFVGYMIVRMVENRLRTVKKWRPTVIAVYEKASCAAQERNTEK